MGNSTPTPKPRKPYTDFPLYAHRNGQWAKKIRGKVHYFGQWPDPQAALARYVEAKDDLHSGRTPRANRGGLTIRDLCNRFLTSKQDLVDCGELQQRSFDDYYRTCRVVLSHLGKNRLAEDLDAVDFERLRATLAKRSGPTTLSNEVGRIRVLFKYAHDAHLVASPVRCGPNFRPPSKRIMRAHRQAAGPKMFESDELRQLLEQAEEPLKAMMLFGINCGYGNRDCGMLTFDALNQREGWAIFPRPKTAIQRTCPLWPETIKAVQEAIDSRPTPRDARDAGRVFITGHGKTWVGKDSSNPISVKCRKLLAAAQMYRKGRGFYALRHTFETIGGESRDQVAVNYIMGHVDESMAATYRQRISDERLESVVAVVREWLF